MISKKLFYTLAVGLSLLVLTSCSTFTNKGKSSKAEEVGRSRIESVDNQLNKNLQNKLVQISQLSFGVGYSLEKINEPPREIVVAKDINQRILSISGNPTVDKMKEMQETIDKLTSAIELERNKGKVRMDEKDAEIVALQDQSRMLAAAKESEIRRYMLTAQEAAANADAYKSALQEYQGWFGLKAVFKGLWQFIKSSLWAIGIGSILFLILRMVSMSNPIAASIFSIFNIMGSWIVRTVKVLFPKAVEIAGHVSVDIFNSYKSTMWKLVDGIQIIKDRASAKGETPNLNDVLDEIAKTMNSEEKAIVEQIKKSLNWK